MRQGFLSWFRKAGVEHQKSRLRVIVVVAVVLIFTFTLLSVTVTPSENRDARWYEVVFFTALSPFQKTSTYLSGKVKGLFNSYVYLVHVAKDNQHLKDNQQNLESQLLLFRRIVTENIRLRALLEFQEAKAWTTVPALVIAHNPQAEFRLLTINRGYKSGLKRRMPVVTSQGLIGQVYRIGRTSAQVLLITDPTSAVDARLDETGARGLIRGRVLSTVWDRNYFVTALEYVDRVAQVPPGGMVVTSGLDGIFPVGIPIGVVRQVRENPYGIFQEADVLPLADPMGAQEVLVVTDWQRE